VQSTVLLRGDTALGGGYSIGVIEYSTAVCEQQRSIVVGAAFCRGEVWEGHKADPVSSRYQYKHCWV